MDRCMLRTELRQTPLHIRQICPPGILLGPHTTNGKGGSELSATVNHWLVHPQHSFGTAIPPLSLTLQDFSGGLLSLAQLFLDAFLSNDFSGIVGNLAKLCLSLLAMSFDVLFIFQHYILYPQHDKSDTSESQPILQSGAE